ncbi:hypothetical protein [Chitinimonas naiadis]
MAQIIDAMEPASGRRERQLVMAALAALIGAGLARRQGDRILQLPSGERYRIDAEGISRLRDQE